MPPWPTSSRALPCAEQNRLEKSSRQVQGRWQLRINREPYSCSQQLLFDHLVRGRHHRGHLDAKRLGGGQIDHQLELGRKLDR